jgi:hypothetical protein
VAAGSQADGAAQRLVDTLPHPMQAPLAKGRLGRLPWGILAREIAPGTAGAQDIEELSLSRLNHWLPRSDAHPEVVQGTAEFHHQVTDPLLPQADSVLHDTTALDAAVDMLDPEPPLVERLVGQVLLQGQLRTAGASSSAPGSRPGGA